MIEPFTYEALPGRVVFGASASREEENIDEAVGLILEAAPESNPRPLDGAGVWGILEDAYAGRRPELVPERSV